MYTGNTSYAYTYKWFRKRVKKVSRLKSIEEVTLQDIENA